MFSATFNFFIYNFSLGSATVTSSNSSSTLNSQASSSVNTQSTSGNLFSNTSTQSLSNSCSASGHNQEQNKHSIKPKPKVKISAVQAWGYTWLKYESSDGIFTEKVWCSTCAKAYGSHKNEKGANLNKGQSQLCSDTLDAPWHGKCHSSSCSHCRAEEQIKKRESSESLDSKML